MMNYEQLRTICLAHPGAVEDYPFGLDVMVCKIQGKVFALIHGAQPLRISLKCDPFWATELRKKYAAITPGYHLSKAHWNTVALDGSVPDEELLDMIQESYALVVKGLTKAQRHEVAQIAVTIDKG